MENKLNDMSDLRYNIIRKMDVNLLLLNFTSTELANEFNVSRDFIRKVSNIQLILKNNEELKLGRGAWKELKQTELYKQLMNK
jgi:hypothetical protein